MRRHRSRPAPTLLSALHLRETGQITNRTFRTTVHTALVPSAIFANITAIPAITIRRFTPCGRYLITLSRDYRDLLLYRLETGAARTVPATPPPPTGLDFVRPAFHPQTTPSPSLEQIISFCPPDPPSAPGLLSTLPVPLRGAPSTPATTNSPLYPHLTPPSRPRPSREDVSHRYSCHFARFFTLHARVPVALTQETLLREFCLATQHGTHLILASYHPRATDPPAVPVFAAAENDPPAVASVPVLHSFTLHLVHVETGTVTDRFSLQDDFVLLDGHAGVHLRGDMLCVLSIRKQVLHVIKVQEALGRFSVQARVGEMCSPDDELVIATARDAELSYVRRMQQMQPERYFPSPKGLVGALDSAAQTGAASSVGRAGTAGTAPARREVAMSDSDDEDVRGAGLDRAGSLTQVERGLGGGKRRSGFYTGLMQRLLVYVYRKYHRDGHQSLFYRVVGQYSQLVMLKAQLLDEDHLLIRLGSHERTTKINDAAQTNTCFFAVYCISSTKIVNLFENRSAELLRIYERYRDLFIGDPAVYATLPASRSALRDDDELDDRGWTSRPGAAGSSGMNGGSGPERRATLKRTRAELAGLPVSCQTGNVSAYLDRSIFSYNEERMSGLNGTRAVSLRDVNAVKFLGATSGRLRFKLAPGMAGISSGGRGRGEDGGVSPVVAFHRKRRALFLFHPTLPFVISMEISIIGSTLYNFHVYGFRE